MRAISETIERALRGDEPTRADVSSLLGADDLGGTLMGERISNPAGAGFGSYAPASELRARVEREGFVARQRTALYHLVEDPAAGHDGFHQPAGAARACAQGGDGWQTT